MTFPGHEARLRRHGGPSRRIVARRGRSELADLHPGRRDGGNSQARYRLDDYFSGSFFSLLVVGLCNDAIVVGPIRIQMHGKDALPVAGERFPVQRIALPCSLVECRTSIQDVLTEIGGK